jgi:hypothetical protein
MPGPLAQHSRETPRAPCEVHALQRFPLISSPNPLGPRAALPFCRTSRLCSADQSLDGVGRPSTAWFPLLGFALRSFLVAPFPFGFPKAPFLPLRHPAEYRASATCRPCCHSTSPSVLPPHLRVFRNRNCDCLTALPLLNFTPVTRVSLPVPRGVCPKTACCRALCSSSTPAHGYNALPA